MGFKPLYLCPGQRGTDSYTSLTKYLPFAHHSSARPTITLTPLLIFPYSASPSPLSHRLRTAPNTAMFPLILPTHPDSIPRPLTALPEPTYPPLAHQALMARRAVLRTVVLLARAPPTDHALGPLVDMLLSLVMALVARVHLLAAREAEPAVRLGVVAAAAALGELGAGHEAQGFFCAAPPGRECCRAGGDAQELDAGDGEGEFLVALAADVGDRLAAHGDDAGCGVGR